MTIINKDFLKDKNTLLLQFILIVIPTFAVLITLDELTHLGILGMVGVTSLASSLCNIVITPNAVTSKPRHVFFGYFIAFIVGIGFFHLESWCIHCGVMGFTGEYKPLFGTLAVGVSFFLMLLFKAVHPASVGFVAALVVEPWDLTTVAVVAVYVCLWTLISYFIRPRLNELF